MTRFFLLLSVVSLCFVPGSLARTGEVVAFLPGERLEYVLKWGGIAAGDSVMEVVHGEPVKDVPTFRIISTAKSRSLVDVFYKVRNQYETHLDALSSLPRKYVFAMNEGGKRKNRVLLFDQDRHFVTRIIREKERTQSRIYEIPEGCHDNLSSLYAMRNEDFQVGDSLTFRVFEGKKNWDLVVDVLVKETITVKAGEFRTVKIHPKLKFEGIFRRKGELHVWMTDDKWHIPVLMKSEVRIGSINAELVRFRVGDGAEDARDRISAGETE